MISRRSSPSLALAAPLALGLVASCSTAEPEVGFDLGADPDELAEEEGKFDDVCAGDPGGPLSGDDLLVQVNKEPGFRLRAAWEPLDIATVPEAWIMPGRESALRIAALEAFGELRQAAQREAGLELGIRSGYRSYGLQCLLFEIKADRHGLEHARRFSAEPGRSQHQLGTAIDITSAALGWRLSQEMGVAPEGIWLAENAHRFGFALSYPEQASDVTGYAWEPWHYRYIGREAAAELHATGHILETYLRACERGDPGLECPREPDPEFEPNQDFIGGACQDSADCAGIGPGAECKTEADGYPGGTCVLPCAGACPDRPGAATTFCAEQPDGGGLCHSKCDSLYFPETGCRPGYECVRAERPDGTAAAGVCVPEVS